MRLLQALDGLREGRLHLIGRVCAVLVHLLSRLRRVLIRLLLRAAHRLRPRCLLATSLTHYLKRLPNQLLQCSQRLVLSLLWSHCLLSLRLGLRLWLWLHRGRHLLLLPFWLNPRFGQIRVYLAKQRSDLALILLSAALILARVRRLLLLFVVVHGSLESLLLREDLRRLMRLLERRERAQNVFHRTLRQLLTLMVAQAFRIIRELRFGPHIRTQKVLLLFKRVTIHPILLGVVLLHVSIRLVVHAHAAHARLVVAHVATVVLVLATAAHLAL